MDDLTDEEIARLFGWARVSFGALAFLAPRWAAKVWTGEDISGTTAVMGLRSLGVRDAALGLGLLIALKRQSPVRGWLEAGALSDAGDALNTLMARRGLPASRSLIGLAAAGGGVVLGRRLADALD
ncbi:MAG: hypothetical protein QOG21_1276 [Actinomycetota bacterium]|jgi:hypothetical protein|nr:hypothetical protein [Actinomycetota bacterium]